MNLKLQGYQIMPTTLDKLPTALACLHLPTGVRLKKDNIELL